MILVVVFGSKLVVATLWPVLIHGRDRRMTSIIARRTLTNPPSHHLHPTAHQVTVNQQFVELTGQSLSAVRDPSVLSALIKVGSRFAH